MMTWLLSLDHASSSFFSPPFSFFPQVNSPPSLFHVPAFSFFTSLSSRGKNVCTIMISASADGAFGMLSPFFDVRVWPLSTIDLSSPWGNSVSTTPANGDGLWLSSRPPVECSATFRRHRFSHLSSIKKRFMLIKGRIIFQLGHLHSLKVHSCKYSSWLFLLKGKTFF